MSLLTFDHSIARFALEDKPLNIRSEQDIFNELEQISSQEGFWEIVAFFGWKDTFIRVAGDQLDSQDLAQHFDKTRLSRTEISTLIGLACKAGYNTAILEFDELQARAEYVWLLLDELHRSFYPPMNRADQSGEDEGSDALGFSQYVQNLFQRGDKNHIMREAIFYGGEGAFKHQYRDLALRRYSFDEDWIVKNKGFNLSQAADVIFTIEQIQLRKANDAITSSNNWLLPYHLPIFSFDVSEIIELSSMNADVVKAVIMAFSAESEEGMDCFNSVDDFNHRNAFPIIKIVDDTFIVFQVYSLWEALYESPFFWFNADKDYKTIASNNRGVFTEDFTAERLAQVFGKGNVLTNINIYDGKKRVGEIDVLVTFGHFAIVVQAKSKKLTIEARKGNSKQLAADFKKAIQDAYDQAYLCSQCLQGNGYKYKDASDKEVHISSDFKTIFPVCMVSEHFPALSAQAREFLAYQTTEIIKHPYVMDVFLIDLITEMLPSPLWVIDYLLKRSGFGEKIISNHELVMLSTYLKQNLYFEGANETTLVLLDDDISVDLELAMLVRRDGFEGERTPPGILTAYKNTFIGKIIDDVGFSTNYGYLKLGLQLLSMSGESINQLNDVISKMIAQYKKDGRHHDISLPLLNDKTGLTFHCNEYDVKTASAQLIAHCERRKYISQADSWVGCCFSPVSQRLRFSSYHEGVWSQSDEMDKLLAGRSSISAQHYASDIKQVSFDRQDNGHKKKIGRNESCHCGSGKKYKHCCGA